MSDLEGKKPNTFFKFAKKNKLSFLALEYSGHGKSSGKFTNGNISKWSKETSTLIKKYIKKNILAPIGMNETTYEFAKVPEKSLANGYRYINNNCFHFFSIE